MPVPASDAVAAEPGSKGCSASAGTHSGAERVHSGGGRRRWRSRARFGRTSRFRRMARRKLLLPRPLCVRDRGARQHKVVVDTYGVAGGHLSLMQRLGAAACAEPAGVGLPRASRERSSPGARERESHLWRQERKGALQQSRGPFGRLQRLILLIAPIRGETIVRFRVPLVKLRPPARHWAPHVTNNSCFC